MPDEMLDGGIDDIEAPPIAPAQAKGNREVKYFLRDGGVEKQHARTSSFSSVGGGGNNAERPSWSSRDRRDCSSGKKQNHAMTSSFSSTGGGGGNAKRDQEGGGRDN